MGICLDGGAERYESITRRVGIRHCVCTCSLVVHRIRTIGYTGAIASVVRDTTGAVLPGVTVEAASSALIEKVRIGVSDAQGN